MPLTPWDSLATELVVDHRWYRLRRDTVRLPSGRIVDDYFVSERADVALAIRSGEVTAAGTVATAYRALDELGRLGPR